MSIYLFKLLIFIAALATFTVSAENELQLTPDVCVIKPDKSCETVVHVTFNSLEATPICLIIPQVVFKLCKAKAKSHTFSVQLAVDKTITFNIINPNTDQIITSSEFAVLTFHSKKTRRKRNFPWSFAK